MNWYNSLWLWRWLPRRLSKCQSLSTTVVQSPIQDHDHPDDHVSPSIWMTPGFKTFIVKLFVFVHGMCTQIPNVSISSKVNVLQIYNISIKLPLFSGKPHCFPPSSVIWRFLSGDRRLFPFEVSGSSARIGTLRPAEIPPQAERVSMREGKFKHRVYRIWPNYHCASFKGIRIPESGDVFPVESGIQIKECRI